MRSICTVQLYLFYIASFMFLIVQKSVVVQNETLKFSHDEWAWRHEPVGREVNYFCSLVHFLYKHKPTKER